MSYAGGKLRVGSGAPAGTDFSAFNDPRLIGQSLQRLSMPGSSMPSAYMQPGPVVGPNFGAIPQAAGGVADWLRKDDAWAKLGGLALGAYGAYQEGKAADNDREMQQAQIDEERRRYEDERNRKSQAAAASAPNIAALVSALKKQAAEAAGLPG